MKNEDLISIIVPIYMVEKYLQRCIESLLIQTYENVEIILIDDGSKDSSSKICDDYKKNNKKIVVIHKENGGLSDARNYGIKIARGKYITFVDSDDYVEKEYIEVLYNELISNDADISICSYTAKYNNGTCLSHATNKKMLLNSKETLEKLLYQEDFDVSAWAKMYKKELFSDILFPKGKIFEDAYTTYKLVLKAKVIACNTISLYNYMIREDSILTAEFTDKKLLLVNAYDEMGEKILKYYSELTNSVIRGKFYARVSTLRQMVYSKKRMKDLENRYRREILKNKNKLLKDKRVKTRDKISILLLIPGINCFKVSWIIYCKMTGRNL